MELSVYDIHHIIAKYLNLRQHVYIVSDCLVFFCSFLCCQCGEYFAQDMPMDGLSETSSVMYQITPRKLEINTVRSEEELSKPHQSKEATEEFTDNLIKCTELWSLVDISRELDGKMEPVQDNNIFVPTLKILNNSPYPENLSPVTTRSNDYPTVHSHKKAQEQHQMSAVETSKNKNLFEDNFI